jgi:hypothetical protein
MFKAYDASDKNKFTSLTLKDGGNVKFGDNSKGKIIGIGNIGKTHSLVIEDVLLVDGLKHNLLSISQLCDKGYNVIFKSIMCIIVNEIDNQVLFVAFRNENVYTIDFDNMTSKESICLAAINENSWLWHRRLGHANMELLSKLSKLDLVKGLPVTKFVKDKICDACQLGKQTKSSFKKKKVISTSRPLELLHMDLFGPIRTASLSGKLYAFVIVDDYSRYTWVLFLAHKNEAHKAFVKHCRRIQNEKGYTINNVRSDRGREFDNQDIELYCDQNGFGHNFSAPRTPQQNGVVERKNRSLQEMSRTMLNEHNLPQYFWAEAVNTACYVINRTIIRNTLNKTPYELWNNRKPNIGYFKVFGCKCFVLNDRDNLGKFDAKSDEGIFLGYSTNSKAYRVFNKRTMVVDESMHVVFDETNPFHIKNNCDDEPISLENKASSSNQVDLSEKVKDQVDEPKDEEKALPPTKNEELPKSWNVVHSHPKELIIGEVERGVSTRSKLKNICNNMAFLSQIEPKNINEAIEDESWILAMQEELNQFERNKDEFEMSMMGELKFFLGLQIKQTEDGIFLNQSKYVIDLLKRFGLTNAKVYGTPMNPSTKLDKDEKGKPVDVKLYRGMIGSLLYLTASRPDIMFSVCLCARFQSCPKESHLIAVKRIFRYLLGTIDLGLWYPKSNSFDLISYTDADFAGCKIDRKSTSGTCHFLGHSLVSWFSKKQNSVALSTAEAEYVAAGSCCAQSLYIKQQLEDFKILFDHIPIRCDNTSAISLSKNPIQHSRTKHIEIRYHFIRDHVQKGDIELEFVSTDSQWADILTKPLIEERFCTIRREIGMARYVDIK